MRAVSASAIAAAFNAARIPGLVSAYLFGSRATGRAHRESDLDIGVLLDWAEYPSSRDRFEARLALVAFLQSAFATNAVDVVILNDAPPHLVRRVMTEGGRVFCSNTEVDHAARRTALLRAADLGPFLRRMRAIKLQAIAR